MFICIKQRTTSLICPYESTTLLLSANSIFSIKLVLFTLLIDEFLEKFLRVVRWRNYFKNFQKPLNIGNQPSLLLSQTTDWKHFVLRLPIRLKPRPSTRQFSHSLKPRRRIGCLQSASSIRPKVFIQYSMQALGRDQR